MPLSDASQAVIITGAAGGIGRALCSAFKKDGYFVIGTGLSMTGRAVNTDVALDLDMNAFVSDRKVAEAFKTRVSDALEGRGLKSIINNAAVQILGSVDELEASDLTRSFNVNVTAPFLMTKLFLEKLTASGGNVLNIGTVHARATKKEFAAYATSKSALHGLTRALAVDLGGKVRVNTLAPAAIATDMLKAGFDGNPEGFEQLSACHPSGRIGTTDEIANTAVFMCSDQANFMTGTTLYVDGGILSRLHDPA